MKRQIAQVEMLRAMDIPVPSDAENDLGRDTPSPSAPHSPREGEEPMPRPALPTVAADDDRPCAVSLPTIFYPREPDVAPLAPPDRGLCEPNSGLPNARDAGDPGQSPPTPAGATAGEPPGALPRPAVPYPGETVLAPIHPQSRRINALVLDLLRCAAAEIIVTFPWPQSLKSLRKLGFDSPPPPAPAVMEEAPFPLPPLPKSAGSQPRRVAAGVPEERVWHQLCLE